MELIWTIEMKYKNRRKVSSKDTFDQKQLTNIRTMCIGCLNIWNLQVQWLLICLVKMKLVNLNNTFAVLQLLIFLFFLSTLHCYYIFFDLLSNRISSCGCICVFWSVLHFLVQFFIFFFVNSSELLSNIGIDLLSGITSRTNKWIES